VIWRRLGHANLGTSSVYLDARLGRHAGECRWGLLAAAV
jgi:hypothetical protein